MPVVPPDPSDFPSASKGRNSSITQESVNGSILKAEQTSAVDYLSRRLEMPDSEWPDMA